ncbi:hypothetical protein N7475_007669 [Penicillium sp. IBT 31633x]|nr:hypothetical protein N7475_007669 [Penicillium sp. IBT 31633x]
MPVFKSLADLLVNLSPRRNRQRSQDQRSTVHPAQPPPSTPPPSRPAGPGHNPFTLGSNTEIDELDEFPTSWSADIATHPKVCIYLSTRISMREDSIFAFGRSYPHFLRGLTLYRQHCHWHVSSA